MENQRLSSLFILMLSILLVAPARANQTTTETDRQVSTQSTINIDETTNSGNQNQKTDVIIDLLGDERSNSADRLRYEPTTSNQKPEPRNHDDDQPQPQAAQVSQPNTETIVIDHRPIETTPIVEVTSTLAPASQAPPPTQSPQQSISWVGAASGPITFVTSSQQPIQQQQQQALTSHSVLVQPSNQIATSTIQQYPTSINSIISDQQQHTQQQPIQSQTLTSASSQPIPATTQMVSLNGQPASVILVNSPGLGSNGRRMSISSWLRGLSSMLANIFNRREHGHQPALAGSSPTGHWLQFGTGAPNWLTQAQVALQQFQGQQHFGGLQANLLGSPSQTRYSIVATPQQQDLQTSATVQAPVTVAHYQSQPVNQQSGQLRAAESTAIKVVQQPQQLQQPQQQQQQPQQQQSQVTTSKTGGQWPHQQQQQLISSQTPRFGRSSAVASNQNLPLAHYSTYSISTTNSSVD